MLALISLIIQIINLDKSGKIRMKFTHNVWYVLTRTLSIREFKHAKFVPWVPNKLQ